jgi:hypothetical protein
MSPGGRERGGRERGGRERGGRERGSVLVLGVGLVAVCLLAVVVLVDASAAFLHRQKLLAVADAAALAGAQAIDLPAYYDHGATGATGLDRSQVPLRVRRHLSQSLAASALEGLTVDAVWSDGQQVAVALSSRLHLPFLGDVFTPTVRVESRARLSYRGASP